MDSSTEWSFCWRFLKQLNWLLFLGFNSSSLKLYILVVQFRQLLLTLSVSSSFDGDTVWRNNIWHFCYFAVFFYYLNKSSVGKSSSSSLHPHGVFRPILFSHDYIWRYKIWASVIFYGQPALYHSALIWKQKKIGREKFVKSEIIIYLTSIHFCADCTFLFSFGSAKKITSYCRLFSATENLIYLL